MQRAYLETRVLIGPCGFQTRQKKNQDIFLGIKKRDTFLGFLMQTLRLSQTFSTFSSGMPFVAKMSYCTRVNRVDRDGGGWGVWVVRSKNLKKCMKLKIMSRGAGDLE